jgi:ubiquinone/menaquinone biosynthesis C-methylase UbiE
MKRSLATYKARLQNAEQAEKYARRFERGSRKRIDRREQAAVRRILSGLPDCKTVLDVPAGAGRFAATLGQAGRKVIGMDAAMEILQFARRRAESAGVRASFAQGDASRLALKDESVDAVFCNRLLHHILGREEREKILRELHRVTRRYAIVSFFDYKKFGAVRSFLKTIKGRQPPYRGQPTREEFSAEVARCGFAVAKIVPTGPFWISQKYFVLEKSRAPDGQTPAR